MKLLSNARAQWLAVNIIPHERAIRSWLARRTHDLDIDDIVQEMYARLAALDDPEKISNPRQYASQTAISIALNLVRHARVVPMIAMFYINAGGSINLSDNFVLYGQIDNLLNKNAPPYPVNWQNPPNNGAHVMLYDLMGRMFRVGVRINN